MSGYGVIDPAESDPLSGARVPRVLIDGRKLQHGGIGTYLENLILGLLEKRSADVSLLADKDVARKLPWIQQVRLFHEPARPYSFDELFLMPRRIPWPEFDLFHVPHFTLPYGIPLPSVITLHDLIHINYPERWYYPWLAGPLIRSALRRARRTIVVSEATRRDVRGLMRHDPEIDSRLRVIPNAIDPFFLESSQTNGATGRIRGPYFVVVASMLKPHKGVVDVLDAFAALKEYLAAPSEEDLDLREYANLKLVLAGGGIEQLASAERLLGKTARVPDLYILGRISKLELRELYQSATALVVPSLAEGFCLPALEAKTCGAPVVARPVPAVLELLGVTDVVCADFSKEKLQEGMREMLRRIARSGAGRYGGVPDRQWVARYDRGCIIDMTVDVYREALGWPRRQSWGPLEVPHPTARMVAVQ